MSQIKNIQLLDGVAKNTDVDKMEYAAVLHGRHSNIVFKIISVNKTRVIVQAVQGKSAAENYASAKRLVEIVHETFDRFFPDRKINVHPIPFKNPPANKVDPEWINNKMFSLGIKLKDVSADTGIDYTQLSTLISGKRPLSQPMKALFWYYFGAKEK